MNRNDEVFPRRANRNRRGQALIFVTMSTTVLFGLTGLVYDFAVMDHDQSLLNASTQAAALAGAQAMAQAGATVTSTTSVVTSYSSQTGDENASRFISGASLVSGYPVFSCLNTLKNSFGIYCYGPSSSNAIQVAQQVSVPLYFLRIFGASSVTLTSVATAAMKGATAGPFNVVIIVDTTRSMTSQDSDSNCSNTRIYCALSGVQTLLKNLSPCIYTQASCGTVIAGNVANSVDRVSLLTFPPVVALTAPNDYNCGILPPVTVGYTTPFPATSSYQVVGFSSDYRTSDTATTLRSSSNLVGAVGATAGAGCIQVLGGFGTYYAQVINAAQTYLAAEKVLYPNSQNVMILLSDGDATATCRTSSGGVCTSGDMVGANTTSTTYPSTLQECHQAIAAAATAATAGTRVYAVAYGAEASGCPSDTNPTITPCQTMQKIASSPGYFFSDYTATGASSSCISESQPVTNLSQIFQVIAGDLTIAKLIPNGTT